MFNIQKVIPLFTLIGFVFPHAQDRVDLSTDIKCIITGAEHMITGYDHILFLIGVVFFLRHYSDIFKFITAFTIAHCITLIFATFTKIEVNVYLIDAVIAFSVIYKGFENLGGFKRWFSINPPNLILMVFIFGLIHGFGLSTSLQTMAKHEEITLSLRQILTFNVGVELGQIAWLTIVFPLLLLLRSGKHFDTISKISNRGLVIAGIVLLIYQLNGFFKQEDDGNSQGNIQCLELSKEKCHKEEFCNWNKDNEKCVVAEADSITKKPKPHKHPLDMRHNMNDYNRHD